MQTKQSPSGPVLSTVVTIASPALPGGPTPILTAPGTVDPTFKAVLVSFPTGYAAGVSVSQAEVDALGQVAFELDNSGPALLAGFPLYILAARP
jgi:hypothetical protein